MASLAQEGSPDFSRTGRETEFEIPGPSLGAEIGFVRRLGSPALPLGLEIIDLSAASGMDGQIFLWGSLWSRPVWTWLGKTSYGGTPLPKRSWSNLGEWRRSLPLLRRGVVVLLKAGRTEWAAFGLAERSGGDWILVPGDSHWAAMFLAREGVSAASVKG